MPRFYKQCVSPDSSCTWVIVIHIVNVIGQGHRDTTMHGCRSWRLYNSDQMCGTVNGHSCQLTQCQRTLLLGSSKNSCCAASTKTHSRATHLSEYSYRQGVRCRHSYTLNLQLFAHQWLDIISFLPANGQPRPMSLISLTSSAFCQWLEA